MANLRHIFYHLPLPLRKAVRRLYFLPTDFWKSISGKSKNEIPPDGKNFIGPGNFEAIGLEFFEYFKLFGKVKPNHQILEIGCGMGRMALPLKSFLNDEGRFYGFDIVEEGISWCNQKIAPKDNRFNFKKANIYNKLYNPSGNIKADTFLFPYPDNQFDFIFATSVFTHMLPNEVFQYLKEANRVLKTEQLALFTFFIVDDFVKNQIEHHNTFMDFKHNENDYYTINTNIPESNIAYDLLWLEKEMNKANFQLLEIKNGSWSGRKEFLSFQDILIVKKVK